MKQFLDLANELPARLKAAKDHDDLFAAKAKLDAEWETAKKDFVRSATRAAEVADAEAKIAVLQKIVDGEV